jgi:F-type H+-transporting ATPase subunit b
MGEYVVLVICLAVLVALVWKPASRLVLGTLDGRAERIRRELDEAARLREEAQALLAKYQRQLHDGEQQAERVLERASEAAERLQRERHAQVEAAIERRRQQAEERIGLEEARAVHQIRARAAELTVAATRRLLEEQIDEQQATALIDRAIADVDKGLAP